MNLGGATNVNLSEAALLLTHSTMRPSVGIQNQQVAPPMMFMQQAVAMQQFQFQQALLIQQVMATQQAATRAATVKSAQEMAAARAAEISKLLKGIKPEVEEEKRSPLRSIFQTASRSRSRSKSFSRSKSRSPLRYRRDRSASQSPIRYRRDSHPLPISREYFGYRGRSRRSYYRGRGEYKWNPSYRHAWEWEKDHYSSRLCRSRSCSRSRVCHRSRTQSRSPRSQRDRSGTPLRYCCEDHKLGHISQCSRSFEARPTPSRINHSRSHSLSRSHSESLHQEQDSQNLIQKPINTKTGVDSSKVDKLSLVLDGGRHLLMKSSNTKTIKEKTYSDAIIDDKEGIVENVSSKPKGREELSISPTRLLSVSLSPPRKKIGRKVEAGPKSNDRKKATLRGIFVQRIDKIATIAEPPYNNMATLRESSPNALVEQETNTKGAFKSKGGEFVIKGKYAKKEFGKMDLSLDESDGDKGVDDWRDDIKANNLEKIKRKESKQEMEKKKEEEKTLHIPIVVQKEVKDHEMALLEHLDRETGILSVDSSFVSKVQGDAIATFRSKIGIPSNNLVSVGPNYSEEICINGSFIKEEILNRVSSGNGEGGVEMDKEVGDVANQKITKSNDVIDKDGECDLVFEGPILPPDFDLDVSGALREGNYSIKNGDNSAKEIGPQELPSVSIEEGIVNLKKKDKSNNKEKKDVRGLQGDKDKSMFKDDNGLYEKHKLKEKSQSKDKSKNKNYDNETNYERRKEKHCKHKRKHLQNEVTENEEDGNDEKKDVDGGKDNKEEQRRHCNKKHRRGRDYKEDKHEKKRGKHKHRGKLTSGSPNKKSLVVEVESEDVDQVAIQVYNKKPSSCKTSRKEVSKSHVHANGNGSD